MNRARAVFVTIVACLAWLSIPLACSENASASVPKIFPGVDYDPIFGADGGSSDRDYYGIAYSNARATVSESYAEAGGWAVAAGVANAWAQVWTTFDAGATGGYNMRMDGYMAYGLYCASTLGVSTAEAHLICRLYDVTDDVYVWTVFLADASVEKTGIDAHDEAEYWAFVKSSYLFQNHRYQVQAHCWIEAAAAALGDAVADCCGDVLNFEGEFFGYQGIWLQSLDFYISGSGGGCVSEGTLITMSDGSQLPVESVRRGDKILGYDVEEKVIVQETVNSIESSCVESLLVINDGLLKLTPTNQPIYARNSAWTGWVMDPEDLELGWELFAPVEDSWIPITKLEVIEGTFRVYDVGTTDPDTFLANDLLLDRKAK